MATNTATPVNSADIGDAILERISQVLGHGYSADVTAAITLRLAEAYAWVTSPNQPHGK